jgi:NADPH:quinone reductase-like Zn-dependent oxidoreductase
VWVRRGVPGHTFPLPIVPGCDGAGVVDAIGAGVANLKVGDRVSLAPGVSCGACEACASGQDQLCRNYGILGETRDGTNAERIVVPARNCLAMPAEQTFEAAAAWPLAFLTAWHMLTRRLELRPGETILVHAAGSGVSAAAIPMAKLLGATVIATAGTDAKCKRALEIGADHAIPYESQDYTAAVRAITNKRGVDAIVNHVGAKTFEGDVKCLVKGGRLVTCGATAGFEMKTDFRLVFFKSLSILGSTMGPLGELHELSRLVSQRKLAPTIDSVFPLEDVREAHRRLGERAVFGKVVLRIGS